MAVAADRAGEGLEAGGGIVGFVEVADAAGGGGVEQEVAAFRHEEKEEAIHEPEDLPVKILAVERARGERRAEGPAFGMGQEAAAERLDRLLHAGG